MVVDIMFPLLLWLFGYAPWFIVLLACTKNKLPKAQAYIKLLRVFKHCICYFLYHEYFKIGRLCSSIIECSIKVLKIKMMRCILEDISLELTIKTPNANLSSNQVPNLNKFD
jgi:hypothetical protein